MTAAKKIYGESVWDNDPGDEPVRTEEEEFELLRRAGMKPDEFADPAVGERYRAWLGVGGPA